MPTATSSASTGRRCPTIRCIDIVAAGGDGGRFHRMCISMITHPRSDADTRVVLKKWVERIKHVPVSILSNPTTMTRLDVQELKDLGADIFTVALDACNREVFDRTRGSGVQSPHSWDKYWEILHAAAEIFGPEHFGAHLIVGMGESDHDVLTPGAEDPRPWRPQPHVRVLSRAGLADGPSAAGAAAAMAAHPARALSHRLSRSSSRTHALRCDRHAHRFRPAAG